MLGLHIFNEIDQLQREMDSLFRGFGFGPAFEVRNQATRYSLKDTGETFRVEAILPGIDVDKLDIKVLGRQLTLSGEYAASSVPEDAVWHRRERRAGAFKQSLQLSTNVDTEKVEAEYKNGVLLIDLPKAASALPRKISVKAG